MQRTQLPPHLEPLRHATQAVYGLSPPPGHERAEQHQPRRMKMKMKMKMKMHPEMKCKEAPGVRSRQFCRTRRRPGAGEKQQADPWPHRLPLPLPLTRLLGASVPARHQFPVKGVACLRWRQTQATRVRAAPVHPSHDRAMQPNESRASQVKAQADLAQQRLRPRSRERMQGPAQQSLHLA